jgi:hypothetical protein
MTDSENGGSVCFIRYINVKYGNDSTDPPATSVHTEILLS